MKSPPVRDTTFTSYIARAYALLRLLQLLPVRHRLPNIRKDPRRGEDRPAYEYCEFRLPCSDIIASYLSAWLALVSAL